MKTKKSSNATETPLSVYERAIERGLRFHLVGHGEVGICGPGAVVSEMNDVIDRHADALVALVEEFLKPGQGCGVALASRVTVSSAVSVADTK